eukprot:5650523-Prymnesium_polylepis.1
MARTAGADPRARVRGLRARGEERRALAPALRCPPRHRRVRAPGAAQSVPVPASPCARTRTHAVARTCT